MIWPLIPRTLIMRYFLLTELEIIKVILVTIQKDFTGI